MIHWNYKLIKSSHGECPTRLALSSKTCNCLITFKVTTTANSWSGAPWGAMESQHRGARVWGWVDGGCRGWRVYIECLCAGLIVLSAEWAHKTKDLLSVARELMHSGNSAQAFFVFFFSARRPKKRGSSSSLVGKFKQRPTLCRSLSFSQSSQCFRRVGRPEKLTWQWESTASHTPTLCCFTHHLHFFSSRYSNTVCVCVWWLLHQMSLWLWGTFYRI